MTACIIFQFTNLDAAKAAEYSARALSVVKKNGGKPVVVGKATALHAANVSAGGAVFEFPNQEAALDWYNGPEYQALLTLRAEAMECSVQLIA